MGHHFHPDDPRMGHDDTAEREEYEACYEAAERFVLRTLRTLQIHAQAMMPLAAICERVGISTAYADILRDEYAAMLALDPEMVAHDVAASVAENLDHGFSADLSEIAREAEAEAAKMMRARA